MTALAVAQLGVDDSLVRTLVGVVGLAFGAGVLAVIAGSIYRWYARARIADGLAVLVGVSLVAVEINSSGALTAVIGGDPDLLTVETAMFNVVTFGLAAMTAAVGARVGDRLGGLVVETAGERALGTDVSAIVRSGGRATVVELPAVEDIRDLEAYDPVPAETKAKLGGETLTFPRRITVDELRTRFAERLRTDFAVGHVDVEFDDEGAIEYLAVGSRESGIGPTLPPGSAAIVIRSDPAFAASAGDVVHAYEHGENGPERVAVGEVRGVVGDVVTLAVDAADAAAFDDTTRYRLVTLPVEPRSDREFASLLRAADETMGVATVAEGSALVDVPVGALDVAVAAVRSPGGGIEAIPSRTRTLAAGDTVYAVARPAKLHRLEAAAGGADDPPLADAPSATDD